MFIRSTTPGVVRRVPTEAELERATGAIPDSRVELLVDPGQDLRKLKDQSAYSFALAALYIPARDHDDLLARYREMCEQLVFDIDAGGEHRTDDRPEVR